MANNMSSQGITYRVGIEEQCGEELISQIAEIERNTFSDAWSEDSITDTLKQDYNMVVVAFQDNSDADLEQQIVCKGYLLASKIAGESELLRIAVDASCRGCGIGRMLMERYIDNLRQDCDRSILEVREGNIAARSLYEQFGYQNISVRKNYYRDPSEDGVIYECVLRQ